MALEAPAWMYSRRVSSLHHRSGEPTTNEEVAIAGRTKYALNALGLRVEGKVPESRVPWTTRSVM